MNATIEPHLRKTIELVDEEIRIRQADIQQLTTTRTSLVELAGGDPATDIQAKQPGEKSKRVARVPRGAGTTTETKPAATVVAGDGEPETLGAAMKLIGKQVGKFTSDQLRQAVKEKYQRLFEEVGPTAFSGNLGYWTKTGKLTLNGDTYTAVNLDF
jgi:hypothetical protein